MISDWLCRCRPPELTSDVIHVWRLDLEAPEALPGDLTALLTQAESERARAFLSARRRHEFTALRALLRRLLSYYLGGVAANEIELTENRHGKLSVKNAETQFNLSHSGRWGVLCFALGRRVGVDVELKSPGLDLSRLAQRVFSPREIERFESLSAGERKEAFFRAWTRKEAFVKAHGEGISLGLKRFDVTLEPGRVAQLLASRIPGDRSGNWQLADLDFGLEHAAALCVERLPPPLRSIECFEWDGVGDGDGISSFSASH